MPPRRNTAHANAAHPCGARRRPALPMHMLQLVLVLSSSAGASRSAIEIITGTEDYGDCRESATCRGDGFYCFKRAGGEYAQCRPRETTPCIEAGYWDPTRHSANDWLCPGWEYCAARHGDCAYSKCCQNALDACLSRVSEQPSQVRSNIRTGRGSNPYTTGHHPCHRGMRKKSH